MANSVDPDQTAPRSSLIWVHSFCFYTKLVSNVRQLFAADDFSRRHFSDAFFSWRFKGFVKEIPKGTLYATLGMQEVTLTCCVSHTNSCING